MDIFSKHPENLKIREYLNNFSNHRREPAYSIMRTGEGRPRPIARAITSADHLPPGYYKTDRDFPSHDYRLQEVSAGFLTRSRRPASISFQKEVARPAVENAYPGPGEYEHPRKGMRSQEHSLPSWTISDTGKGTSRPIPRDVTAADHLGPGLYRKRNHFNEIGWRTSLIVERAASKIKGDNWAAPQYSHVFNCMKPDLYKAASSPSISLHSTWSRAKRG
mmetsp:Transcript_46983/g.102246  ORF Transcript_46983/g.102246 Transcript_46983/m.102246 type:complete len:220 (-) Transcript_46983:80-739(-)